ncbi:hypothetical protein LBBP_02049 [Leptospira borgpetersenii serovar Ballum]|uniref:Uncharacterized protein n=1 Tax=Leptospira borgpetersenii serovar Ballum TaxID=280505 RepID=A0A0S2IS75_LEPBO|nr:hypothetical protein LBBP_02049 [Leptospira borgpetersenii serovar Ballum]
MRTRIDSDDSQVKNSRTNLKKDKQEEPASSLSFKEETAPGIFGESLKFFFE